MSRALIVDDEPAIRELMQLTLARFGLECDTAGELAEGLARLRQAPYALCLADLKLPDGSGLDLVEQIQQSWPQMPVAIITAFGSPDTAVAALKAGAFDYLTKPVELPRLKALIEHALKLDRTRPGQRRLIGHSEPMQLVRAQISRLARSQAPVFIFGESGTGKEVIARLIHESGPRTEQPFVPVNCGAIPAELIESELFGHRKGAFTGASSDKPGLFRAAQGGTLFLDEIGELPLAMQVKLLRAIQERAVRPVGGHEELSVDVRILSASHRDLAQLVHEGRFRQDLYYRVNVIELRVPPLRERRQDLPELIEALLGQIAGRYGGAPPELGADALDRLYRHRFPGNVRELENRLERAYALCEGGVIHAADLDLDGGPGEPGLAPEPAAASFTPTGNAHPPASTRVIEPAPGDPEAEEQRRVLATLEQHRWNRTRAAESLGMTLRQLRYRLQKWGLSDR